MPALLMTRPLAASRQFADSLAPELRARLRVILAPLMEIRPVPEVLSLDGTAGVIFTSQNGAEAASALTAERRPAYCVGSRTAAEATARGWQAECLGPDAGALVAALIARRPAPPLLHLRGTHTRGDVAKRLTAAGLPCGEQVVYDQVLRPLSPEALAALRAQDGIIVPLFSPRAARHFASLCPDAPDLHLIALSDAVADPLRSLNCKGLQVCTAPDAAAMAAAVRDAAERLARVEGRPDAQ